MDINEKKYFREERKQRLIFFWTLQKKQFIKNKNIIHQLVKRNVKVLYRNSAIGILWTVLNPLLNMLVMYFVFSNILGYNEPTYPLYLLCGNIIFNMMRGATTQSLTSIVNSRGLLTKNKISYSVFPISCNLSAVVNFLFSYIALLFVMFVVSIANSIPIFSLNLLLTFVMFPALLLFCIGLSFILSALYVFFRDISHIYNVFLTLWMYLTPIFYKTDRFGEGFKSIVVKSIIEMNPMYHFITYFRDVTYACAYENIALPSLQETLIIYMIGFISLFVGSLVFSLTKKKFIFNL